MTEERSGPVAPENDLPGIPASAGGLPGIPVSAGGAPDAYGVGTVEALRAELEQARQQQLCAVADYQNLQRRAQEERAEFGRYQITAIVLNLLPVLDDLERAVEAAHDDIRDHPWVEGIRLVLQKFRGVMEASGLQEIHALQQPFSPERHEAAGTAPGPEGRVVRILRRGYVLNARVVRPAMVMVGDGEHAPPAEQQHPEAPGAAPAGGGPSW